MKQQHSSKKKPTEGTSINVLIWTWALDIDASKQREYFETLSVSEQKRVTNYIYETDKERFIMARGRTRELLGQLIDISPHEIIFQYGKNGKPYLPAPSRLFFNFSRSQNLACLAVCSDKEIGVDIEKIRPIERHGVESFFSPREQKDLSAMTDDIWLKSFYRCWTSKEAFVKAIGEGLSYPLNKFDVSVATDQPAQLLCIDGEYELSNGWEILDFSPQSGYMGALAIAAKSQNVSLQITHL